MKSKWIALISITLLLFGCGTLPLPSGLTDAELRNATISKFGTDQYMQIHQVIYSPTASIFGDTSQAYALWDKMNQSQTGRLDLIVVSSSSKGLAKEIRKAFELRRGDWGKLNLLFVGSESDALVLKPDVEKAGINFAWYEK